MSGICSVLGDLIVVHKRVAVYDRAHRIHYPLSRSKCQSDFFAKTPHFSLDVFVQEYMPVLVNEKVEAGAKMPIGEQGSL
jgi:hypothetical protein